MGKEKKDVKNGETKKPLSETEEEKYPLTPEEATSFEASNSPSVAGGAGWFNRKGVLMVLSFAFVLVVGGGLLFNTLRSTRGETEEEEPLGETARAPRDLLESLKEDAERRKNLNCNS